jgi:aldehyde dehydrogenase (NAD+)
MVFDNSYRMLIGGALESGSASFDVINPATEAVIAQAADATDYGLGGSIWAKDEDKAWDLAQKIQSGTVWVNETQHLSPLAAFGGVKQSGVGVEGGLEGLLEYTNAQTLVRRKKAAFVQ